jgi:hypothetical protein
VTLHRLRIGEGNVSIRFQRQPEGGSTYEVLQKTGTVHVVTQPSPNSLRDGVWDRIAALLQPRLSL